MIIFWLLLLMVFFWLCFKFTALMLKLIYFFCVGLPLAILLGVAGLLFCCTVILIPVGTGLFRMARRLVLPF